MLMNRIPGHNPNNVAHSATGASIPREPRYHKNERATRKEYDPNTGRWIETEIIVQLDPTPFQEGTLRHIYFMRDLSLPEGEQDCVAKVSKDPNEPRDTYYFDVKMQLKAKQYAQLFNQYNPPKKIDFVVPWVVEFKERYAPRGGRLTMNAERILPGDYIKHSNNYGFVHQQDRNTPQAFSHFSFQASNQTLLVCDIQGVEDNYTDPQIHSVQMSFGKADLGREGIQKFFASHRCNAICQFLQLQAVSGMRKDITFTDVFSISPTPSASTPSDNSSEVASSSTQSEKEDDDSRSKIVSTGIPTTNAGKNPPNVPTTTTTSTNPTSPLQVTSAIPIKKGGSGYQSIPVSPPAPSSQPAGTSPPRSSKVPSSKPPVQPQAISTSQGNKQSSGSQQHWQMVRNSVHSRGYQSYPYGSAGQSYGSLYIQQPSGFTAAPSYRM